MPRKFLIALGAFALLAMLATGYLLGSRTSAPGGAGADVASPTRAERRVLYWRHPDGETTYAAAPMRTTSGKPYLPVFDDQEPDFPENAAQKQMAASSSRKLLYYRNPMGLPDTSPSPKKDWMGMDYIPVYEGEQQDSSIVKVNLDRVQRAGVRTEAVRMLRLARPVRVPGVAKPDERTLRTVTLRADGFIEKLFVSETGRHVKAGEPLFRVYSPQMVAAQVDYRTANAGAGTRDERGALQRLKNLGVPDAVLDELRRTREPVIAFDWPAPVSGVVMQKKVMEGQMVKAGEEMFRFADLSSIWVIADVPEQDIALIKVGATAQVSFRAFPGETFDGDVTFVLHELEMATRTAKVRIEVRNPDHRIKHEMFADVMINAGASEPERLVVPVSALIDSGNRQVVIVDRGEGRFEPRAVKPGTRGDGYVEIMEGVKVGEQIVVTANFLIDAESNLKAALSGFTAEPAAKPEPKP
jgi:membrane fusion protein, copper/silver efflux system